MEPVESRGLGLFEVDIRLNCLSVDAVVVLLVRVDGDLAEEHRLLQLATHRRQAARRLALDTPRHEAAPAEALLAVLLRSPLADALVEVALGRSQAHEHRPG